MCYEVQREINSGMMSKRGTTLHTYLLTYLHTAEHNIVTYIQSMVAA